MSGYAIAAISEQETAQLGGPTLTPIGAEKAGTKDGMIPAWTGGITKGADGWYYDGKLKVPFSKFDPKKSGYRPDPFADDNILFTVSAQNMNQYKEKLTTGLQALMAKYPNEVKLNVYPSRRSMSYNDHLVETQKKVALTARLEKDGNSLVGCWGAFPFPIPKNGLEVIWNHTVNWSGTVEFYRYKGYLVTAAGRPVMTNRANAYYEYPFWDPNPSVADKDTESIIFKVLDDTIGPVNRVGEGTIGWHFTDKTKGGPAWIYLPGQRRVKLAPEVSFDGPNTNLAGQAVIDECYMFVGSPERYDWKLIGKKEMLVPYNNYKAQFWTKTLDLLGKKFLKPEPVRFEMHRVWVIEAKLKPGQRHIYHKRILYLDEDSWYTYMEDLYDAKGQLWRTKLLLNTFNYDVQAPSNKNDTGFDLIAGTYYVNTHPGSDEGGVWYLPQRGPNFWVPAILAGRGIR
jgi:hypothetical protein